jgi:Domain of unknown function (DUF4160)
MCDARGFSKPMANRLRLIRGSHRSDLCTGTKGDEGIHAQPHFHARYSGQVASVALDGEIIAGSLPPRAAALVAEWATLHGAGLEANWARARREESLVAIEPLP